MSTSATSRVGPHSAVTLAADRLRLSRLQLQQVLMPSPGGSGQARTHGAGTGRAHHARWLDRLLTAPAASLLLVSLQGWWARHPMRLALRLAGDTAETLVQPVAQKHPVQLMLGAAATGALLVLSRPWRWLPRAALTPALLAGLVPALLNASASPLSSTAWMGWRGLQQPPQKR